MHVEITIKVAAESRGELIDTFAGVYREFRAHLEGLQATGVLPQTPIRWILVGGRWGMDMEKEAT